MAEEWGGARARPLLWRGRDGWSLGGEVTFLVVQLLPALDLGALPVACPIRTLDSEMSPGLSGLGRVSKYTPRI